MLSFDENASGLGKHHGFHLKRQATFYLTRPPQMTLTGNFGMHIIMLPYKILVKCFQVLLLLRS